MSGEKIGSLTNNSCGGWGSRIQTGKYLTRHPHLLLSWVAWGWGRNGLSIHWEGWEWGDGQSGLSGRGSLEGREDTLASEALPQCDLLFPLWHMHRLSEVRTGTTHGIESEPCWYCHQEFIDGLWWAEHSAGCVTDWKHSDMWYLPWAYNLVRETETTTEGNEKDL